MPDPETSLARVDVEASVVRWLKLASDETERAGPGQSFKPSPASPESERPLASGFALHEALGRGGMGEVFRARQEALQRDVAYKKLRGALRSQPAAREAFLAEAVVTGQLEHPNIIPIYALGEDNGELFMAMKLAGGRTWRQQLSEQPASSLDSQLEVLLKVCDAVAFAHSLQISHNDLKPANIMLGDFGEVLVLDWGLALDTSDTPRAGSRIRHCSSVREPCGTPSYMAPELALGMGDCVGPWTDIYLLGGILYRLLTGQPPHGTGSLEEVVRCASQTAAVAFPASVPERLRWICEKALSRLPRNRHHEVADFRAELAAYRSHKASYQLADQARVRLERCQREAAVSSASAAAAERYRLYEGFAAAAAGFRQAREIWQANPDAVQGERQARQSCAETALRLGDLGLALVHSRALEEAGGDAAELRTGIARRRRALQRLRSKAVWLRRGMLAALLGIMLLLALWKRQSDHDVERLTAEKAQLEASRTQVMAERNRAEQNASLALGAFTKTISKIRHKLLDEVSTPRAHQVSREILQEAADGLSRIRVASSVREVAAASARAGLGELKLDLADDPEGALEDFKAAEQSLAARLDAGTLQGAELEVYCGLLDLLGEAQLTLTRLDEARLPLERALQLREGMPGVLPEQLVQNLYLLSRVAIEQGQLERARGFQQRGLELCQAWIAADSTDSALRRLALLYGAQSETLEQLGQDGTQSSARALEAAGRLMERDPNSRTHLLLQTESLLRMGDMHLHQDELQQAEDCYRQALELGHRLAALDPRHADTRKLLALGLWRVGYLRAQTALWPEARDHFEQALQWLDVDNRVQRPMAVRLLAELGEACLRMGEGPAAAEAFQAALAWAEELPWGEARLQLARKAAIWRVGQQDIDGALALFEDCWRGCRQLESSPPWLHGQMLAMQLSHAGLQERLGHPEVSQACLEEALSFGSQALQNQPQARTLLHNLACLQESLGRLHYQAGRAQEARAAFEQGCVYGAQLAGLSTRAANLRQYGVNLEWLGSIAHEHGDLEVGQAALSACVELRRELHGRGSTATSARDLWVALRLLLALEWEAGSLSEARDLAIEAAALARQRLDEHKGEEQREQLGETLIELAQLQEALGHPQAALELVEECLRERWLPGLDEALRVEQARLRKLLGLE